MDYSERQVNMLLKNAMCLMLVFQGVPLMMLQQDFVWVVLWKHLSIYMPEELFTEI